MIEYWSGREFNNCLVYEVVWYSIFDLIVMYIRFLEYYWYLVYIGKKFWNLGRVENGSSDRISGIDR